MKFRLCIATLLTVMTTTANAQDSGDCFPDCRVSPDAAAATASPAAMGCGSTLVSKVEDINNQIKPVKELIGYVRSPQGLALKLVNDHIVKIPAWVGYALDPVGSLRHKAIDEVRGYAKSAAGQGSSCAATGVMAGNLSVDAA